MQLNTSQKVIDKTQESVRAIDRLQVNGDGWTDPFVRHFPEVYAEALKQAGFSQGECDEAQSVTRHYLTEIKESLERARYLLVEFGTELVANQSKARRTQGADAPFKI